MRSRAGVTLAELLLAAGISMGLLVIAGMMVSGYAKNFRRVSQRGITLQALLVGLDRMRLEALEATVVEVPPEGHESAQFCFRVFNTLRGPDSTEVQYSLHPDGAVWRKTVSPQGVFEAPIAFQIAHLRCNRHGPLLELTLVPLQGPAMTASLAVPR